MEQTQRSAAVFIASSPMWSSFVLLVLISEIQKYSIIFISPQKEK